LNGFCWLQWIYYVSVAAEVGWFQNLIANLSRNAIEQRHVGVSALFTVPVASINRAKALGAASINPRVDRQLRQRREVCQPESSFHLC